MPQQKYKLIIEDTSTGKKEEKTFLSLDKAESLARMVKLYGGLNKRVELFDSEGEKIL
jgi:uncharacterized protein (DUF2384 family)